MRVDTSIRCDRNGADETTGRKREKENIHQFLIPSTQDAARNSPPLPPLPPLGPHFKTRELRQNRQTNLRFITREIAVGVRETLESDRELDVARADDVLDLELGELGVEAKLLNNSGVSKASVHERRSEGGRQVEGQRRGTKAGEGKEHASIPAWCVCVIFPGSFLSFE